MRKKILLIVSFIVLFYSNIFCQWNQLGSEIVDTTYGFGRAISLNATGNIFATGDADGTAAVYKFENEDWVQLGEPIIKDAYWSNAGWKLSINDSGTILAVGDYNFQADNRYGNTQVFELLTDHWTQIGEDITGKYEDGYFGHSVELNGSGNILVVGAPREDSTLINDQSIYVFNYIDTSWTILGDKQSDYSSEVYLGREVAISKDGKIIAASGKIGDTYAVRLFRYESGEWNQLGNDLICERGTGYLFGQDIELSNDGYTVAIGSTGSVFLTNGTHKCYVAVYNYQDGSWSKVGTDIEGEWASEFGNRISLNAEGNLLAACGRSSTNGKGTYAQVYGYNGAEWMLRHTIQAEGGRAPESVSLNDNGDILAVGEIVYTDTIEGLMNRMRIFKSCATYNSIFIHEADSFAMPDGAVITKSGVYNDTLSNSAGCDSVISYIVTIENEISDLPQTDYPALKVYPNPSKGIVVFDYDNLNSIENVKVFSISGYEVDYKIYNNTIDLGTNRNGIYFIKFYFNDKLVTKKVILE